MRAAIVQKEKALRGTSIIMANCSAEYSYTRNSLYINVSRCDSRLQEIAVTVARLYHCQSPAVDRESLWLQE